MKKKILPIVAAVVLIMILIAIGVVSKVVDKYIPTDERMDAAEYYHITKEGQVPVILQDEVSDYMSILVDETPYLHYEMVREYLNDHFYWDEKNTQMLYTTPTDLLKIPAGSADYTISDQKISWGLIIVRMDGEVPYIAADFVQQYTNMKYQVFTEPSRVLLTYKWQNIAQCKLKREDSVRYQGGVKSPILTDLEKGATVTVLEQMENWSKVVTEDGYVGYIRNQRMGDLFTTTLSNEFTEPIYTSITRDHKINLVWHQITTMDSNYSLGADIAAMTGVNVISPTWFSVVSKDGTISSLAESSYVTTAHENGLEVWA